MATPTVAIAGTTRFPKNPHQLLLVDAAGVRSGVNGTGFSFSKESAVLFG